MENFFLSVGEPSGDLLGAELLAALQSKLPQFRAFGIAGPRLKANPQFEAVADIADLSVMGFVEVIKHLSYIKRIEDRLLAIIDEKQPAFAILVDYPGFHMRLAEFLQARGIYVIQYVAPQLWAWGERRTKRLRAVTDLVVGIMPFEEQFFVERAVHYRYAGTPQVERAAGAVASLQQFGLDPSAPVLGFFPGSRRGEVSRLLPVLRRTADYILSQDPQLTIAISVAPSLDLELFEASFPELQDVVDRNSSEVHLHRIVFVKGRSLDLMASVSAAVVTSGTATLECALVRTPLCVAYRMSPVSYQLAKRLINLDSVSLVNLVAGERVIREFIQDFDEVSLGDELLRLAKPGSYREATLGEIVKLDSKLHGGLAERSAAIIIDCTLRGKSS